MVTCCSHWGKRPDECAIDRYHQGKDLFERDRQILERFPCLYCDLATHATHMCQVRHGYCSTCSIRGHRPIKKNGKMIKRGKSAKCHITEEMSSHYEVLFARFAAMGIHTGKPPAKTEGWVRRVPNEHRCMLHYWSETEEEDWRRRWRERRF